MKICIYEKGVNKREWHNWFAWHPVLIKSRRGSVYLVWGHFVRRKRRHGIGLISWKSYEYSETGLNLV